MKYFLTILLTLTLILCKKEDDFVKSNSQLLDFVFPTPSIGGTRPLRIYFPTDYNKDDNSKKYNTIIFLHGSSGNSSAAISSSLKSAADTLIARNKIKSCIIVMPDLQHLKEPSYGNRHLYVNSEYYGDYADVILKDLFNYLKTTNDQNLNNKALTSKDNIALGGFSMGGDGALRLAFNNPDKFSAVAGHGPATSFALPIMNSGIIPSILAENVKDANGNYTYDSNNPQSTTTAIWGLSAAFSKLLNNKVQFILNPNGILNTTLYNDWLAKGDCLSIIKLKSLYTGSNNGPSFYIEVGSSDPFKGVNDYFINNEIVTIPIDSKYYQYVVSSGKGHGFDMERAMGSLEFLGSKMK